MARRTTLSGPGVTSMTFSRGQYPLGVLLSTISTNSLTHISFRTEPFSSLDEILNIFSKLPFPNIVGHCLAGTSTLFRGEVFLFEKARGKIHTASSVDEMVGGYWLRILRVHAIMWERSSI